MRDLRPRADLNDPRLDINNNHIFLLLLCVVMKMAVIRENSRRGPSFQFGACIFMNGSVHHAEKKTFSFSYATVQEQVFKGESSGPIKVKVWGGHKTGRGSWD